MFDIKSFIEGLIIGMLVIGLFLIAEKYESIHKRKRNHV